jgi:site-specific DNA recombinase
MFGKTRHQIAYLACEPQRQHHKGRRDWYSDHPKSLWVREEILLDAVRGFFTKRIFGPDRRRHLRAQLQRVADTETNDTTTDRRKQLTRELADLQRRQANLVDQLENFEATGDADADREYRQSIQRRFAELTGVRRAKQAELDQLKIDSQRPATTPTYSIRSLG